MKYDDNTLIPIDETILVEEAALTVPYLDIKTAYEYIMSSAAMWRVNLPPEVSELMSRWQEFLVENF